MSDERRNRFDDLKHAYVLGALNESERREFEDYLAEHPELQTEVDDLGSIANLLAFTPQEHEPSPELRRNLLSSIEGATDVPSTEHSPRLAGLRRLFGPGGLAAAAIAAVAVAAVVGLSVWNASLSGENANLQSELQTRQAYQLQGSGAARDVHGEVIRMGDGQAVLVAENLPSPPEGKVYEAWLMRDGVPEPAGTFDPPDKGDAAMHIESSLKDTDAVAVTVEPSGGSLAPTSEPLMTANL